MATQSILRQPFQAWNQAKLAFFRTEKTQILLRGSISILFLRGCGLILRMIMGVLLARMLGVSGYGVYAYAVSWLAFLTIPTTLGLDQVLLRYVAAYKETQSWSALKGLLRFSFALAVGSAITVSLVSITIVYLVRDITWDIRSTMWITCALLPIVVLAQVRQSSLRGLDHPVMAQIPENIIYPCLLLLFASGMSLLLGTSLTVIQAAWSNAAAWTGAFLIGTFFFLRKLPKPIRASTMIYEKSQWMSMVPPLIFIGGAYHLLSRGDVLVLGALGTSRDVGLYAIASRGGELMLFMYDAITLAGASLFSSIYVTGDLKELQRFTSLATKTILWISFPIYIIFMAIAPWFLGLFGPEFVEGVAVMRFLTTTYFLSSLGGFVIIMLYMTGRERDVAVIMGILALVNLGLSFLLIPQLGMLGAAIASGTTLVLLKGTLVFVLYKRVGILSLPINIVRETVGPDLPNSE